jgi:S1-C subfamily serine protease
MRVLTQMSFRRLLLLVAGLVAAGVPAGFAFARGTGTPIGNGVVVIDTNLAYQGNAAAGTGMVLTSSGEVLTNNHVISGATTIKVVVPNTGRGYPARVLGYDRTADVALLQLQGASNLKTVSISSARLSAGATVTALGNAGGNGSITSATGTVTGLGKSITASDDTGDSEQLTGLIETNAEVQPGDSGGPLVNTEGRVVGMDTAASSGFGFQGVSSTVLRRCPDRRRRVRRAGRRRRPCCGRCDHRDQRPRDLVADGGLRRRAHEEARGEDQRCVRRPVRRESRRERDARQRPASVIRR